MVRGSLALVDGGGFAKHERELLALRLAVVLVLEGGRLSRNGHAAGLVGSAPAGPCLSNLTQIFSTSPPSSCAWTCSTVPHAPFTRPSCTSMLCRSITRAPTATCRKVSRPPVFSGSAQTASGNKGAPVLTLMSTAGQSCSCAPELSRCSLMYSAGCLPPRLCEWRGGARRLALASSRCSA